MLPTYKENRNTNKNPKMRGWRKNKLEKDLWVKITSKNTEK